VVAVNPHPGHVRPASPSRARCRHPVARMDDINHHSQVTLSAPWLRKSRTRCRHAAMVDADILRMRSWRWRPAPWDSVRTAVSPVPSLVPPNDARWRRSIHEPGLE